MLLWLVTTAALAVAVPAAWAQKTLVNEDGYAALALKAATDAKLQQAMASVLTTQAVSLAEGGNGGPRRGDGLPRTLCAQADTGVIDDA
jgi:hypothetical protein